MSSARICTATSCPLLSYLNRKILYSHFVSDQCCGTGRVLVGSRWKGIEFQAKKGPKGPILWPALLHWLDICKNVNNFYCGSSNRRQFNTWVKQLSFIKQYRWKLCPFCLRGANIVFFYFGVSQKPAYAVAVLKKTYLKNLRSKTSLHDSFTKRFKKNES